MDTSTLIQHSVDFFPKPVLWQSEPLKFSPWKSCSATLSEESRLLWARKQCMILKEQHRESAPTHFLTFKFKEVKTVEEIKAYLTQCGQKAKNIRKHNDFGVYLCLEVDKANKVHGHVLIRTSKPSWIAKHAHRVFGHSGAEVWHEPIKEVDAASAYTVKFTKRKQPLLFKMGLKLPLVHQWGYFTRTKADLWRAAKARSMASRKKQDQTTKPIEIDNQPEKPVFEPPQSVAVERRERAWDQLKRLQHCVQPMAG